MDYSKNMPTGTYSKNVSEPIIPIFLKFRDDYADTWGRNADNTLPFAQVRQILTTNPHRCFFQKQKSGGKGDKSRHKIIVPLEDEKAIELGVTLWNGKVDAFTEVFGYFAGKSKEIPFFAEPTKDTLAYHCSFHVGDLKDKQGTQSSLFKDMYKRVEALPVPSVDINKEKDKRIWTNYVIALKKLIKQKEQIWKIKEVRRPYTDTNSDNERVNYIDILINEKDLSRQFEAELKHYFNAQGLEDYGANEDNAFIEFNTYQELTSEQRDKLHEIANEYFYDISNDSPIHYFAGDIIFKYVDSTSKEEVISQLKGILKDEYQIECTIDEYGRLDITETDLPHIRKVVSDNFDSLLEVKQNNDIELKVNVEAPLITSAILLQAKSLLQEEGLNPDRLKISITEDQRQLILEINAHIRADIFKDLGLFQKERANRFGTNRKCNLQEIEGLQIVEGEYQVAFISKREEKERILETIKQTNQDHSFRQLPTRYVFIISHEQDINKLRSFKTGTDQPGMTSFQIQRSMLTIQAMDNQEYQSHLQRIQKAFPEVMIEKKEYQPTFYLEFKTDQKEQRQEIINKIQEEVSRHQVGDVRYDSVKNDTRIFFTCYFQAKEERRNFRKVMAEACIPYKHLLTYSFENNLGKTRYEFAKNETLEKEKENETVKNVRQATFIYLTPDEKNKLDEVVQQDGLDAYFNGGKSIGTLMRKERDKLIFRMNHTFDELVNAREDERLTLEEIKRGYIKPIFPGELTNISRMIKAMRKVTEPGGKVEFPVNKNLPNFLFDPNTARLSYEDIEEEKSRILENLNEPLLKNQPKQLEAVAKSLLATDLALIQGPPGTGKTTVIAEIIWQTLLRDPGAKILITSQTNLAVDNALERLKGKQLVRPIRIGNIDKFEDEGKVYSDKRLKDWIAAKTDSDDEQINADNAICEWIKNISHRSSDSETHQNTIAKWKKGLSRKDSWIKTTFSGRYFKHVNVFAATCSECGSRNFGESYRTMFQKNNEKQGEPEFDLVIMDEASKATPPELILPLTLAKKVVIIGDHKQLPPMIDENEFSEALEAVGAKNLVEDWTKDDYKISQFEKLFVNAPDRLVASLDTQFRMHEQIMNCISQFYKDQNTLESGLICGIKSQMDVPNLAVKASRWHGFNLPPFIEPDIHAIWVNVETPETKKGTSYENEGEIDAIRTVLQALTKAEGFREYLDFFEKEEDKEIGIITYYMPQMQQIKRVIYPTLDKHDWRNFDQHKYRNEFQIPFRINTVDRFQGMERNIILISTVRSDRQIDVEGKEQKNNKYPYALGFARELQRVNVGFSRAKRLLIIVGNEKHFANKAEYAEAIQRMHRVDIAQLQNL